MFFRLIFCKKVFWNEAKYSLQYEHQGKLCPAKIRTIPPQNFRGTEIQETRNRMFGQLRCPLAVFPWAALSCGNCREDGVSLADFLRWVAVVYTHASQHCIVPVNCWSRVRLMLRSSRSRWTWAPDGQAPSHAGASVLGLSLSK